MKNKEKLCSIAKASAAVVLFLILVSSAASASITEKWITTNPSISQNPAIYGNKIVWQDYRNGNPDIYMGTISSAFTASPTSGKAPLTVKFADKSTDVYYWTWNFGDGTTSTDQSPTHKYMKAGKYTVTLTVKNAAGISTAKKTLTVS